MYVLVDLFMFTLLLLSTQPIAANNQRSKVKHGWVEGSSGEPRLRAGDLSLTLPASEGVVRVLDLLGQRQRLPVYRRERLERRPKERVFPFEVAVAEDTPYQQKRISL
jgi:hypothetical protein